MFGHHGRPDGAIIPNLNFIPRYELSVSTFIPVIYFLCLTPILLLVLSEISAWRAEKRKPKHCRQFGLESHSNLYDQYRDYYSEGMKPGRFKDMVPKWRVKALVIHPIKSCKEIELHKGSVFGYGMQYDRQFCFAYLKPPSSSPDGAQEEQWTFLTRREHAKLAQVKVDLWIPENRKWPEDKAIPKEVKSGGVLVVTFPNPSFTKAGFLSRMIKTIKDEGAETTFHVPFNPSPDEKYPLEAMKIWKDCPTAVNMGKHVPASFKEFLGIEQKVALFRVDPEHYRQVYRCAPRKDELGYQSHTGFADAYPLHLMNLASVRDLGKRVKDDLPRLDAKRFRSNIIITGPEAYEEDQWKKIRIGKFEYYCVCRTARCKLPNVDPDTGKKHAKEPDKTMRSFRQIDEGAPMLACLGMQMVPAKEGKLMVLPSSWEKSGADGYFIQKARSPLGMKSRSWRRASTFISSSEGLMRTTWATRLS
jgi:uncharacterized protein YcbX